MTRDEAIKMIKAKLECMTRDVSGIFEDCYMNRCDECALNYDQGNMGDQKEWLKMSIQALEQEPCEDAVSRQEVLNTLDKRFDSIPSGQTIEILLLRKDLRELPPVTPTGWITVSDRMPKPNEAEHLIAKYYLVQNEYGDMMVARWDGKGWKQMYQPNSYLEDDVIAWTPLPSPYELQESEED